ncbi:putative sensory box histidine kinase/response regulator [Cystobacter fuscus DSM 2262]|uniref:histidine kinase n=1 Tax=Cystobacter fuscus (strain ATCC 25194 / DSM 2262 / NBRC 100088 / M29) TaxID=1242864 RepID=S9P250_CYSF2|nr:ATP-binding protein [Cystobacter fuscus]EPX58535.1 putative sensory box histidine kinase/response regulator [Cystobacter fuscus DSM 2262]
MRALLVPSASIDLSSVELLVRQLGMTPTRRSDDEAAITAFRQSPFPLVLMGMDDEGDRIVLVRALRASPNGAQAAIVLVARPEQLEGLASMIDAGVDDFLMLPLDETAAMLRLQLAERRLAERPAPLPENFELDGLCAVLLRESPLATCITTREGNAFVEVNEAFTRLFGYSREEMLWRTARDLDLWESPIEQERLAARMREQGMVRGVESRVRTKSGELRDVLVYVGIAEYAGTPHIVTLFPDVTERKLMQARLQLADRMASVGTLAAGVAHEINNPLAYVLANLGYAHGELSRQLSRGAPGVLQPVSTALGEALHGAERVQTIVGDLKTFSRESTAEQFHAVNVRKVLDSTLNLAAAEIRHRAKLVKNYGEDVPPIHGNESRLGQVFLNLLVNAVQSLPSDGDAEQHEIRVTTRLDASGQVAVEIADTGAGIAPELMGRIFDPFFTTKPPGVGTGLGLSICHNLITAMGGELHVFSDLGRGTTFQVLMPSSREPIVPALLEPVPEYSGGPRGRVLVIDDEPLLCSALERILRPHHDVVFTTLAAEVLPRLEAGERFDLILCDLMMPRMNGMDFHAALHRLRPELTGRVIFLTGGAFTPQAKAFLERVPNRRVEKPFNARTLLEITREVLTSVG